MLLDGNKEYFITPGEYLDDESIYGLKLTDELVEKITAGQKDLNNLQDVEFTLSNSSKTFDTLRIGTQTFQFMEVKETQPIHLLLHPTAKSKELLLLGSVTKKLNPKLELEASKAEAIRQRSQEAEKERLARKTVEVDIITTNRGKTNTKSIKRRGSITTTTTTIPSGIKSNSSSASSNTSSATAPGYPLRTRTIQLLAIRPLPLQEILTKLNTSNFMIGPIIAEVAQVRPGADSLCSLKPEYYSHVKVSDWPFYSMMEREQVGRLINPRSEASHYTYTPPETPSTPSPKKQMINHNHKIASTTAATATATITRSVPSSAKKTNSVKDRLSAILKKRR